MEPRNVINTEMKNPFQKDEYVSQYITVMIMYLGPTGMKKVVLSMKMVRIIIANFLGFLLA